MENKPEIRTFWEYYNPERLVSIFNVDTFKFEQKYLTD